MRQVHFQSMSGGGSPDTPEWNEWRKAGLGASDSVSIAPESIYPPGFHKPTWAKDAKHVIAQKIGLLPPTQMNDAMRAGKGMEEHIRALYAPDAEPSFGECDDDPRIRASFDGIVQGGDGAIREIVEIKYHAGFNGQTSSSFHAANSEKPHYIAQMAHQAIVAWGNPENWDDSPKIVRLVSVDGANDLPLSEKPYSSVPYDFSKGEMRAFAVRLWEQLQEAADVLDFAREVYGNFDYGQIVREILSKDERMHAGWSEDITKLKAVERAADTLKKTLIEKIELEGEKIELGDVTLSRRARTFFSSERVRSELAHHGESIECWRGKGAHRIILRPTDDDIGDEIVSGLSLDEVDRIASAYAALKRIERPLSDRVKGVSEAVKQAMIEGQVALYAMVDPEHPMPVLPASMSIDGVDVNLSSVQGRVSLKDAATYLEQTYGIDPERLKETREWIEVRVNRDLSEREKSIEESIRRSIGLEM